jgi:hypothetical protein
MQHLLSTPVIGREKRFRDATKAATKRPLGLRVAGVVVLVAASLVAIADQSDKFVSAQEIVGLHEIPSFVAQRVELTPGVNVDSPADGAGPAPSGGTTLTDLPTGNRLWAR